MSSKRQQSDLSEESSYNTEDERLGTCSSSSNKKKKKASTRLTNVTDRTLVTLERKHPGVFVKASGHASSPMVLCSFCNSTVDIACGTKQCDSHVRTKKHARNVSVREGQKDLFSSGLKRNASDGEKDVVLDAEIILSQWIAGNNLPFVKTTELVQ